MQPGHRIALALLFSSISAQTGCGRTFGVEAVETDTEIVESAEGIELLVVDELALDESLSVCGDGDRLRAQVNALSWQSKDEVSETEVIASFARDMSQAKLEVGGDDENLSLRRIEIQVPRQVAPKLSLNQGEIRVCDFDSAVEASAEHVSLEDIAGSAIIDADTTDISFTLPIDLESSGSVSGTLSSGGDIVASGDVILHYDSEEEELSELSIDSGAGIQLIIGGQKGYTLEIRSTGYASVAAGTVLYASDAEDAESPAGGLVLEIRGGGPMLRLTGASVMVGE